MAESVTIARPYAEAVFKIAREKNALAQWSDALANLDAVVGDTRVQGIISDPNVSAQQLEGLVLGVIGDKFGAEVAKEARNFIQVLVQNGRLELTPHIRGVYEGLKREHEGTLEATVISALPISDEQVKALVATLETKFKRKITAKVEIDPQLIGGVKIVVGDKVIDATVRGRLDAMATALTH
ncbi:MAG: F0F1 ATP synthase subunit delta [Burkholderiales bacterium]|nr:F0F1 ATP synthase subunit delta [Burkholderiales bacterium]